MRVPPRLLRVPATARRRHRIRRGTAYALTLLLFLLGGPSATADADAGQDPSVRPSLTVRTDRGVLRGVAHGDTDALLGVRYAAPPTGALRWRAPEPAPRWRGVRTAAAPGPVCPQPGRQGAEDCLYLNVHRPHDVRRGERLPVMVWLHGGGFTTGAGSDFDPAELVTENRIVVVTVNYRLGALGFLAHPALADGHGATAPSGNYGLLDQQAALRWVRTNIGGWNGDPGKVTLAGESAGGGSVCGQLAAPAARGLFRAAVIESDDCVHDVDTLQEAEARGADVAAEVHCPGGREERATAACLRDTPAADLVQATGYIAPNVSGTLPLLPAKAIATGRWNAVPVLMGGNREEGRAFATDHLRDTPADYRKWLATAPAWPPGSTGAPAFGNAATAEAIEEAYPLEDFPQPYPAAYAVAAVITDSGTRGLGGCTTLDTARSLALQQPVHYYQLEDPRPPRMSAEPADYDYAAAHAYELPYLFPRLADGEGKVYAEQMTAAQRRLAERMRRSWGTFVRTLDPRTTGSAPWPALTATGGRYAALRPSGTGSTTPVSAYSEQHHCRLWDRITLP